VCIVNSLPLAGIQYGTIDHSFLEKQNIGGSANVE
jgi:hypothetical protein